MERGPAAKLPTARELCEILGTTRATLDSALGELEAQNIITRKQGSGIYVSTTLHRKSVTIALASSLFIDNKGASPFWGILLGNLVAEAQKRSAAGDHSYHFQLITEQDAGWDERLLGQLLGKHLHGVMMVGTNGGVLLEKAEAKDLAVVSYAAPGRWQVISDSGAVVQLGAAALLNQGCRRIGMWRPVVNMWTLEYEDTVWGPYIDFVRSMLEERNLAFYPEMMKDYRHLRTEPNADPSDLRQTQGYRITMEVFGDSEGVKPDGVVCADDLMTVGALVALQDLGIKVGEDIKIATHANVGSMVFFGRADKMTLIEFDPAAITKALFDTLERVMAGDRPPKVLPMVRPAIRV